MLVTEKQCGFTELVLFSNLFAYITGLHLNYDVLRFMKFEVELNVVNFKLCKTLKMFIFQQSNPTSIFKG